MPVLFGKIFIVDWAPVLIKNTHLPLSSITYSVLLTLKLPVMG